MKTKEEIATQKRAWQIANKEKIAAYTRKWQATHRILLNARGRSYHKTHREKILPTMRARNATRRTQVLDHYGSRCVCCGETTPEFLAIDHINGGGSKHRKIVGSGGRFYSWLIKSGFPDGFQILCHNCNTAKGVYGVCPHQGKLQQAGI